MTKEVIVIDKGWNMIQRNIKKAGKGLNVAVGWQGTQAGIDHEGFTNVELASVMEFGTKDGTIPPRPMLRQTMAANESSYQKEYARIVGGFFDGGTLEGQLLLLGERYKNDIIKSVKNNEFAPWKEITAAMKEALGKGGDVPLWDTGQMINAMTAVVVPIGSKK